MSRFKHGLARAGLVVNLALVAIIAASIAAGSVLADEKRSIVLVHGA